MKLKILIIALTIFLLSACSDIIYDENTIVENIQISECKYYKYKIEIYAVPCNIILYTNHSYTVGDIVRFK